MTATFFDLKKKVVLITGATRGIGREIALFLASQNCHIVFNYREGKETVAEDLSRILRERGAYDVHALHFDVTNSKQLKEVLSPFVKKVAPISGLVNNAGICKDQLLLRLNEEDLRKTLETNLMGSILTTQALSRGLLKAKSSSIVNISSIIGLQGNSGQISYASSKAGLIGFTKSLAKEMASKNVRCNAICPGFIETEMTKSLEETKREQYLSHIPLKRLGNCSDVAFLVAFFLSNASSYITGEVVKIDGGLYI